jgi:hypothetical protein
LVAHVDERERPDPATRQFGCHSAPDAACRTGNYCHLSSHLHGASPDILLHCTIITVLSMDVTPASAKKRARIVRIWHSATRRPASG